MKTAKPTPETTRLDPQAVALLTEARETIRDQAEAIGSLTANLEEAQCEVRALNATVDNLTAQLKALEESPIEILGTSVFMRKGGRVVLCHDLTSRGVEMGRAEFASFAAVASTLATDLVREIAEEGRP